MRGVMTDPVALTTLTKPITLAQLAMSPEMRPVAAVVQDWLKPEMRPPELLWAETDAAAMVSETRSEPVAIMLKIVDGWMGGCVVGWFKL